MKITTEILQAIYDRANEFAKAKYYSEPDGILLYSDGSIDLADLMEKHNATLILEMCWDSEYESHAELDFEVGGQFLMGNFYAAPLAKLSADDFRKISANCG